MCVTYRILLQLIISSLYDRVTVLLLFQRGACVHCEELLLDTADFEPLNYR